MIVLILLALAAAAAAAAAAKKKPTPKPTPPKEPPVIVVAGPGQPAPTPPGLSRFSWERPVSVIGAAADQSAASAFHNHGNSSQWGQGGGIPTASIAFPWDGWGAHAIYDGRPVGSGGQATTTIDVYWLLYPTDGMPQPLTNVPWDSSFVPTSEGDSTIRIDISATPDYNAEGYDFWRIYGTNFEYLPRPWIFEALDPLQDCWAAGWRPGSLLVGQAMHRTANGANTGTYQGHGGAYVPTAAGTLLLQEWIDAANAGTAVPHAITIAAVNLDNGVYAAANNLYVAPGNRVEKADNTESRNGWLAVSPDSRLFPEGTRLYVEADNTEIEAWLDSRSYTGNKRKAAKAVALTLVQYGVIAWETGDGQPVAYGQALGGSFPGAAAARTALGIATEYEVTTLMDGFITETNLRVANPDMAVHP